MSARRGEQYAMSLAVERGAARIRITDSGSPTRVPRGESRLPVHRMRLRTHTEARQSGLDQLENDSPRPRYPSSAAPDTLDYSSGATTVIANSYEAPRLSSLSSPLTIHEGTPKSREGAFLTFTPSPTRDESRIWEYDPSAQQDFVIWEDHPDEDYSFQLTPLAYSDLDEDKENTYATVSDYDSPEEDELEDSGLDWRLRLGPRDAFGLPLDATFGQTLRESPVQPVPTVTDTNVRPAVRAVFRDEEESDVEWDESLTRTQIREIQELTDIFARGAENRRLYDRHIPMRDFNAQGQANIFLEVRRITEFQRHRDRRHSGEEDEEE